MWYFRGFPRLTTTVAAVSSRVWSKYGCQAQFMSQRWMHVQRFYQLRASEIKIQKSRTGLNQDTCVIASYITIIKQQRDFNRSYEKHLKSVTGRRRGAEVLQVHCFDCILTGPEHLLTLVSWRCQMTVIFCSLTAGFLEVKLFLPVRKLVIH